MHELTELLGCCPTPNELYHFMTQASPLESVVQTSPYDHTHLPTRKVNPIPPPTVITPARESTREETFSFGCVPSVAPSPQPLDPIEFNHHSSSCRTSGDATMASVSQCSTGGSTHHSRESGGCRRGYVA